MLCPLSCIFFFFFLFFSVFVPNFWTAPSRFIAPTIHCAFTMRSLSMMMILGWVSYGAGFWLWWVLNTMVLTDHHWFNLVLQAYIYFTIFSLARQTWLNERQEGLGRETWYEASHTRINCLCHDPGKGNLNVEYVLTFILCSCIGVSAGLMTGDSLMETGCPKSFTVWSCSCLGSGLVVMRMRLRMTVGMRRRMSGSQRLSLGGMGVFFPSLHVLI